MEKTEKMIMEFSRIKPIYIERAFKGIFQNCYIPCCQLQSSMQLNQNVKRRKYRRIQIENTKVIKHNKNDAGTQILTNSDSLTNSRLDAIESRQHFEKKKPINAIENNNFSKINEDIEKSNGSEVVIDNNDATTICLTSSKNNLVHTNDTENDDFLNHNTCNIKSIKNLKTNNTVTEYSKSDQNQKNPLVQTNIVDAKKIDDRNSNYNNKNGYKITKAKNSVIDKPSLNEQNDNNQNALMQPEITDSEIQIKRLNSSSNKLKQKINKAKSYCRTECLKNKNVNQNLKNDSDITSDTNKVVEFTDSNKDSEKLKNLCYDSRKKYLINEANLEQETTSLPLYNNSDKQTEKLNGTVITGNTSKQHQSDNPMKSINFSVNKNQNGNNKEMVPNCDNEETEYLQNNKKFKKRKASSADKECDNTKQKKHKHDSTIYKKHVVVINTIDNLNNVDTSDTENNKKETNNDIKTSEIYSTGVHDSDSTSSLKLNNQLTLPRTTKYSASANDLIYNQDYGNICDQKNTLKKNKVISNANDENTNFNATAIDNEVVSNRGILNNIPFNKFRIKRTRQFREANLIPNDVNNFNGYNNINANLDNAEDLPNNNNILCQNIGQEVVKHCENDVKGITINNSNITNDHNKQNQNANKLINISENNNNIYFNKIITAVTNDNQSTGIIYKKVSSQVGNNVNDTSERSVVTNSTNPDHNIIANQEETNLVSALRNSVDIDCHGDSAASKTLANELITKTIHNCIDKSFCTSNNSVTNKLTMQSNTGIIQEHPVEIIIPNDSNNSSLANENDNFDHNKKKISNIEHSKKNDDKISNNNMNYYKDKVLNHLSHKKNNGILNDNKNHSDDIKKGYIGNTVNINTINKGRIRVKNIHELNLSVASENHDVLQVDSQLNQCAMQTSSLNLEVSSIPVFTSAHIDNTNHSPMEITYNSNSDFPLIRNTSNSKSEITPSLGQTNPLSTQTFSITNQQIGQTYSQIQTTISQPVQNIVNNKPEMIPLVRFTKSPATTPLFNSTNQQTFQSHSQIQTPISATIQNTLNNKPVMSSSIGITKPTPTSIHTNQQVFQSYPQVQISTSTAIQNTSNNKPETILLAGFTTVSSTPSSSNGNHQIFQFHSQDPKSVLPPMQDTLNNMSEMFSPVICTKSSTLLLNNINQRNIQPHPQMEEPVSTVVQNESNKFSSVGYVQLPLSNGQCDMNTIMQSHSPLTNMCTSSSKNKKCSLPNKETITKFADILEKIVKLQPNDIQLHQYRLQLSEKWKEITKDLEIDNLKIFFQIHFLHLTNEINNRLIFSENVFTNVQKLLCTHLRTNENLDNQLLNILKSNTFQDDCSNLVKWLAQNNSNTCRESEGQGDELKKLDEIRKSVVDSYDNFNKSLSMQKEQSQIQLHGNAEQLNVCNQNIATINNSNNTNNSINYVSTNNVLPSNNHKLSSKLPPPYNNYFKASDTTSYRSNTQVNYNNGSVYNNPINICNSTNWNNPNVANFQNEIPPQSNVDNCKSGINNLMQSNNNQTLILSSNLMPDRQFPQYVQNQNRYMESDKILDQLNKFLRENYLWHRIP